jgi:ubiquinone/menaquinone biosynthesis C-methylase UbiE
MQNKEAHNKRIIDQFSKQSVPFTTVPGHLDSINSLILMSGVKPTDAVLDVACGPGLVTCEFAKAAEKVVGIDMTPAMLETARNRQLELGLNNLGWELGDALHLPFEDQSFDVVITRYSFHHLLSPELALAEMIRVCKQGGSVLVADVAIPERNAAHYDHLELLRDPSHTHALTEIEFDRLYHESGLSECRYTSYQVDIELESQLKASFPNLGDTEIVRRLVTEDVGINQLGIGARTIDGQTWYSVPIRVYVGQRLI